MMKWRKLTRPDGEPVWVSASGSVQSAKGEGGPPNVKTRIFFAGELHFVREDPAAAVDILREL